MIKQESTNDLPEIAFYYPGTIWNSVEWIKNLILFFDGVGLLVPEYMKDRPFISDPAIAEGLDMYGLLHILEPEKLIDKDATNKLATVMTDIITSGELDVLAKENTAFHEISYSRLGGSGDAGLAQMIFEELKARGLARDSEDDVSIPMHPMVRSLILVLLSQILRPQGQNIGLDLSPATDNPTVIRALSELLSIQKMPPTQNISAGKIVSFDLETIGTDLSIFPIDEVLSFRQEYLKEHRRYALTVRRFVRELSLMSDEEREEAFEERQSELQELASEIRKVSKKAWKKPASFALSIIGAGVSAATGNPIGAIISAAATITGAKLTETVNTGAYSYIFRATSRFRY